MARKFLYFIAFLIVLVIAGAFVLNIWSKELTRLAFVPSGRFVEQSPLASNAYQDPAMWLSRPGMGVSDPARWQPAFEEAETDQSTATPAPAARASHTWRLRSAQPAARPTQCNSTVAVSMPARVNQALSLPASS